jgi:O-antigen/teichoic acid export membrane protein
LLETIIQKSGLSAQTVATMLLQVASIALVVASNVLLTRWLGSEAFARYSYIVSWLQLLAPVALFGLYDLTLKEFSALVATDNKPKIAHFLQKILTETLFFSIFISISILIFSFAIGQGQIFENRYTMLIGAPTIVFFAYIMQVQAILRAYNRASAALLSEKIVRPALLVFIAGFYFVFRAAEHNAWLGVAWATFCTFWAAVFSTIMLLQTLRKAEQPLFLFLKKINPETPENENTYFEIDRKAQFYFLLLSLLGIAFIRIDALLLGELGFIAQVGVYNIATRFTDLLGIVLQTLTFMVVPQFAVLAQKGDKTALQALVSQTARTTFLYTIPLFVGLMVCGRFVLGVHGAEFEAGFPLLIVLGAVGLIYAFLGDNNYLLLMQGHSRTAFACMLLGFVCALILEILLIPHYGMLGAAIGRGVGSLVFYGATAIMVWRKSGILPSAAGVFYTK